MKHSNQYLYGRDNVVGIPDSVIEERIELLNSNLSSLLEVPYEIRDNQRITDIVKAVKFWKSIKDNDV